LLLYLNPSRCALTTILLINKIKGDDTRYVDIWAQLLSLLREQKVL
jgi:hypothetical protein